MTCIHHRTSITVHPPCLGVSVMLGTQRGRTEGRQQIHIWELSTMDFKKPIISYDQDMNLTYFHSVITYDISNFVGYS